MDNGVLAIQKSVIRAHMSLKSCYLSRKMDFVDPGLESMDCLVVPHHHM